MWDSGYVETLIIMQIGETEMLELKQGSLILGWN